MNVRSPVLCEYIHRVRIAAGISSADRDDEIEACYWHDLTINHAVFALSRPKSEPSVKEQMSAIVVETSI